MLRRFEIPPEVMELPIRREIRVAMRLAGCSTQAQYADWLAERAGLRRPYHHRQTVDGRHFVERAVFVAMATLVTVPVTTNPSDAEVVVYAEAQRLGLTPPFQPLEYAENMQCFLVREA